MAVAPDPFWMREICQKAATPPKLEDEKLKSSNKEGQAFARAWDVLHFEMRLQSDSNTFIMHFLSPGKRHDDRVKQKDNTLQYNPAQEQRN